MTNDPKNVTGGRFANTRDDFQVRSESNRLKFLTRDIPPPGDCYVGVDDRLLITLLSENNTNTAIVNVRILRDDGEIIPLTFTLATTASKTLTQSAQQLVEGYILSVAVVSQFVTGDINPSFACVSIVRPPNTIAAQHEVLAAGYISTAYPLCYPSMVPIRPTDGIGFPAAQNPGAPAAGAEIVYTAPANSRIRIVSLSGLLTTSAAVANRNVKIVIDDGATIYYEASAGFSQAASLANRYSFADGVSPTALFDGCVALPLPSNLWLSPGHRVRTLTTALDVADQWSTALIMVHTQVQV